VEVGRKSETLSGTPQGGIISPLLANIALDGLQRLFGADATAVFKVDRATIKPPLTPAAGTHRSDASTAIRHACAQ